MNKKQIEWFQTEAKMLDTLYAERMKRWKRLAKAYDLEFQSKIRDLKSSEYVKISEFYPLVRQVVATVAMNYPTMFFEVMDDESQDGDIEPILERAAAALLEITDAKSHVHQAVTDALFCGIGWIRTDYNPPGQDLTSPYLPNSEQEEDLPSFSRVAPGMVHVDPTTQPNNLGTARYIREKLWIPLKSLMDDKSIKKTKELKASPVDRGTEVGFGELMFNKDDDDEAAAVRSAIENGEFVLVDRWHMWTSHSRTLCIPSRGAYSSSARTSLAGPCSMTPRLRLTPSWMLRPRTRTASWANLALAGWWSTGFRSRRSNSTCIPPATIRPRTWPTWRTSRTASWNPSVGRPAFRSGSHVRV